MINRNMMHRRCVWNGLRVRPLFLPDEEWAAWQAERAAMVLRAQQHAAQAKLYAQAQRQYLEAQRKERRMLQRDAERRAAR